MKITHSRGVMKKPYWYKGRIVYIYVPRGMSDKEFKEIMKLR